MQSSIMSYNEFDMTKIDFNALMYLEHISQVSLLYFLQWMDELQRDFRTALCLYCHASDQTYVQYLRTVSQNNIKIVYCNCKQITSI